MAREKEFVFDSKTLLHVEWSPGCTAHYEALNGRTKIYKNKYSFSKTFYLGCK